MHLPVTIEVGKHFASFFTVLLICETYRIEYLIMEEIISLENMENLSGLIIRTLLDMKALSGSATIGERVPS